MLNTIELSLRHYREQGCTAEKVEQRDTRTWLLHDFLNLFDILVLTPNVMGVLGVQTTTRSKVSAHMKKMRASRKLKLWKAAGNRAVCQGWEMKRRGNRRIYCLTERTL